MEPESPKEKPVYSKSPSSSPISEVVLPVLGSNHAVRTEESANFLESGADERQLKPMDRGFGAWSYVSVNQVAQAVQLMGSPIQLIAAFLMETVIWGKIAFSGSRSIGRTEITTRHSGRIWHHAPNLACDGAICVAEIVKAAPASRGHLILGHHLLLR